MYTYICIRQLVSFNISIFLSSRDIWKIKLRVKLFLVVLGIINCFLTESVTIALNGISTWKGIRSNLFCNYDSNAFERYDRSNFLLNSDEIVGKIFFFFKKKALTQTYQLIIFHK